MIDMNNVRLKLIASILCLLVCTETPAQKLPVASPAVMGVPEAIQYGTHEVDPKGRGGGGPGFPKMFVSPEGRFKALFKGTPEKKEREVVNGLKSVTFSSSLGRSMKFGITYFDLSKDNNAGDSKTIFDGNRDSLAQSFQLAVSNESDFLSSGYPGRESTFESDRLILKTHVLVVGKRFYQLNVFAINNSGIKFTLNRETREFFDSFKFVIQGQESTLTSGPAAAFENADFTGKSLGPNYESEYFAIKLELTDDWKSGVYGQTGASSAYKNLNVRMLFATGKKAVSEGQAIIPFLVLGIEQLPAEQTSAASYLEANKRSLADAGLDPKITRDVYSQKLDGVNFFVMDAETQQRGRVVKNRVFATVRKGVMLFCVLQGSTDEDMKGLSTLINRIKFDKVD